MVIEPSELSLFKVNWPGIGSSYNLGKFLSTILDSSKGELCISGEPQLASLKFRTLLVEDLGKGKSRMVIISKWLARDHLMAGTVSHLRTGYTVELFRQTLSGFVQLPAEVWRVGMLLGCTRTMSYVLLLVILLYMLNRERNLLAPLCKSDCGDVAVQNG